MNGLTCSHYLGLLLPAEPEPVTRADFDAAWAAMVADRKRRFLLPYACPTCGTRTGHTRPHYTDQGRLCHEAVVWDGVDQIETKESDHE